MKYGSKWLWFILAYYLSILVKHKSLKNKLKKELNRYSSELAEQVQLALFLLAPTSQ